MHKHRNISLGMPSIIATGILIHPTILNFKSSQPRYSIVISATAPLTYLSLLGLQTVKSLTTLGLGKGLFACVFTIVNNCIFFT